MVLVCIDNKVRCYPCFDESKMFAVNILHESQEEISRRFATKSDEKFTGIPWHTGGAGLPLLDGAIAHIECKIVQSYPGGDHTIFLGEVITAIVSGERPLLFFRGKYMQLPKS
jgi:flavin reductase (DIM6/NTAB) family NADH-FMN oxidoreductase RutF